MQCFFFPLHFYSLTELIVSPSLIQRELMIQHLQICTLCTVMTGNGFFSLTFSWRAWCDQSYPSNWISYETLPTNGREKARKCKKMGFICPLFTRWCLAVYLVLNFFYHQKKKKKSDCIQILGVKRSDTGWLFSIMMSLQSGLQSTIDSLASLAKQRSSIGGYLSSSPHLSSFSLTILHLTRSS